MFSWFTQSIKFNWFWWDSTEKTKKSNWVEAQASSIHDWLMSTNENNSFTWNSSSSSPVFKFHGWCLEHLSTISSITNLQSILFSALRKTSFNIAGPRSPWPGLFIALLSDLWIAPTLPTSPWTTIFSNVSIDLQDPSAGASGQSGMYCLCSIHY